jgi:hypothetical protein
VKYILAPGFLPEFERLPPHHRAPFFAAIKEINAAYARRGELAVRWRRIGDHRIYENP